MDSKLSVNHCEPEKLRMAVDHEDPRFWFRVYQEIKPHLRCPRVCYNEGIPNISDPPTKETQPGTQPGTQPELTPSIGCNLMSLPIELILEIYQLTTEPYELKIFLAPHSHPPWPCKYYTHMMIQEPRTWASMNLLHVCRLFRNLVIARYGQPQRDSLPFSPKADKLVVLGVDQYYFLATPEPIVFMDKRIGLKHLRKLQRNIIDPVGVFLYYNKLSPENPRIHLATMGKGLLDQVRHLEFRFSGATHEFGWPSLFHVLTLSLPNVKRLEITLNGYDGCELKDGDMDIGTNHFYRHQYMRFFDALIEYKRHFVDREGYPKLFPQVESLEITRTPLCSLVWKHRLEDRLDWFIDDR
ncbi:hypothetical protein K445DRAFT_318061 [Daldinia sp. EC12]|nr:hypothetical protein K445DRAFT_318061 [Daldinia sp. EC12]